MALHLLVLFPILAALLGYLSHFRHVKAGILITQTIILGLSIALFLRVHKEGMNVAYLGGYTDGIGITLYADRLATVMILLTSFLFANMLLFNYKKSYMNKLFLFLFLVLQGLINAIFLSGDLFNIYALIEVSTIIVSILIMYKKDNRSIYDGIVYLIANVVSMTFFLLGVGYCYKLFGTLDYHLISNALHLMENPNDILLPYALIMTAIVLKSAEIMPFFNWLPKAHGTPSAPSIVSALLSGLYVKTGIYMFIRLREAFMPVVDASTIFIVLGFIAAISGAVFAFSQTDIKLILTYSTVSQIGLIFFSLNLGLETSYWGGIYHIINHAAFKSTLLLTAGILIQNYGTRNIHEIRHVGRNFPFISVIMVMSMLGITGAPFFDGSISKYLIHAGASENHILEYGLLLINFGTIIIFVRFASVLFGKQKIACPVPHPVSLNQKVALGLLGVFTFIGGMTGLWIINLLFGITVDISLSGYLEKSIIFLASLATGILFYKFIYPAMSLFSKIREVELNVNQIAFSIAVFFAGLLTVLRLYY